MNRTLFIKILISLSLLILLAVKINWANVSGLLSGTSGFFHILALVALLGQITLLALRWLLFANLDRHRIGYGTSWRITIASLLANLLFITSLGGVVVKVAMTAQYGFPWLKSICAGVADRVMTLLAIAVLALLALPLTLAYFDPHHLNSLVWIGVFGVSGLMALVWFMQQETFYRLVFYNRKTALAAHYIRDLFTRHGALIRIVAVSLVAQLFYFVSVYCLVLSMDLSVSLRDIFAVLPFVTLVASLPVGFGGWGVREGAFVYGFGLIGIPVEAAFFISVQIGVLTIISTVIAGIPALVSGDYRDIYDRILAGRYGQNASHS